MGLCPAWRWLSRLSAGNASISASADATGIKAGSISVSREDSILVRNLEWGALPQNIMGPLSAHY